MRVRAAEEPRRSRRSSAIRRKANENGRIRLAPLPVARVRPGDDTSDDEGKGEDDLAEVDRELKIEQQLNQLTEYEAERQQRMGRLKKDLLDQTNYTFLNARREADMKRLEEINRKEGDDFQDIAEEPEAPTGLRRVVNSTLMNPVLRIWLVLVFLVGLLLAVFENACRKQGKSIGSDCLG